MTSDVVNKPKHYTQGKVECIDAIKEMCGSGFKDYCRGSVVKYLWRYDKKNGIEDLRKAQWFLNALINYETKSPHSK